MRKLFGKIRYFQHKKAVNLDKNFKNYVRTLISAPNYDIKTTARRLDNIPQILRSLSLVRFALNVEIS